MRLILLLVALAVGAPASAQQAPPLLPTIQNGFGTLSVTAVSAAVSTVTAGVNSNIWRMPIFGNLVIQNSPSSAGLLYVCPFGGTCTSGGWPVAVGGSITFNLGGSTTSPTVIAATTATAVIGW